MTRPRGKQKRKSPVFPPVEKLEIGAPFNPYELFNYGPLRRQIFSCAALSDNQKLLWLFLADQCQFNGIDKHSQASMAALLAWDPRKLRRHIKKLKDLKLVHVDWNLGEPARTWLLYHPLFALCSPLTKDKNVLRLGQKYPKGKDKNVPNKDFLHGSSAWSNHESLDVGTSNSAPSAARDEDLPNKNGWRNAGPAVPITNSLETLTVSAEAKSFWFSLPPKEKQHRLEDGYRAAAQVTYYRQYIHEKDHTTAAVARRKVEEHLNKLRGLGFYIPGIDPKRKP